MATDIRIFSFRRTIFVNKLTNLNGNLAMYDISGRLVQTIQFGANLISPIQTSFPTRCVYCKSHHKNSCGYKSFNTAIKNTQ